MDLILWRHAQAEDGTPDAARALTSRGHRDARDVARWLRRHLPAPVRVLASPAVRTRETATHYTAQFEACEALAVGGTARRLLALAGWPAAAETVLVVGHQPTLGEAAALALTGRPAPWSVRKGGLWWLRHRTGEAPRVVCVMDPRLIRD